MYERFIRLIKLDFPFKSNTCTHDCNVEYVRLIFPVNNKHPLGNNLSTDTNDPLTITSLTNYGISYIILSLDAQYLYTFSSYYKSLSTLITVVYVAIYSKGTSWIYNGYTNISFL